MQCSARPTDKRKKKKKKGECFNFNTRKYFGLALVEKLYTVKSYFYQLGLPIHSLQIGLWESCNTQPCVKCVTGNFWHIEWKWAFGFRSAPHSSCHAEAFYQRYSTSVSTSSLSACLFRAFHVAAVCLLGAVCLSVAPDFPCLSHNSHPSYTAAQTVEERWARCHQPGRQLGSPSVALKTWYPPKCILLA